MTDQERQRERELKAEVTKDLSDNIGAYRETYDARAGGADPRLWTYCETVAGDPEGHNLYEQLAVRRFFRLLKKYEWNAQRVRRFIRFYEALKLDGVGARRQYRMTPVQVFQTAGIFGLSDSQGRRLTRLSWIFVPRKFSKTTYAAVLMVYDFLFGDSNAEAYIGANSEDQAKKGFREARLIMQGLDPKGRRFRVNEERISVRDPRLGRSSSIQCLTAGAKTKDGLYASLVIMDEYSQARDTASRNGADLKNVLTSSMGPRREPLTVVITTASEVVDGPCYRELEGVKAVLRGDAPEYDEMFASLFMPDADDAEDDPRTWRKVQPHLGVTVQADYYEKEWRAAQLSADNRLAFRTKLLNLFAVKDNRAWIGAELARQIARPLRLEDLRGRPDGMAAFDLSVCGDFSAVTVAWYARPVFFYHTAYFFPAGALEGHPNRRMYETWAEQGHLILTKGPVIDYRAVVDYILNANRYVRILNIGYDAYKAAEPVNMLAASGAANVLTAIRQTYGTFTAPVEVFEHGAKSGNIVINDNPINFFCFGNCVLDHDRLENCKPLKRAEYMEIDGVITTLMCGRLFMDCER
ncbi:MAG: terminase large subunit [Prevotellaceae bacterium]|nr:terminase large subunit [Prevotellaceae bacterium]